MSEVDLGAFARRSLTAAGAAVEPDGRGVLEALLPASAHEALGLPELVRISLSPGTAGDGRDRPPGEDTVRLGFGTELLERLTRLTQGSGRVAALRASGPPCPQHPPDSLAGLNVSLRRGTVTRREATTLVAIARYSARSDDERLGLVRAAILLPSGTPVPDPDPRDVRLEWSSLDAERLAAAEIRAGLPRLLAVARRRAALEIESFRRGTSRRRRRDVARLESYFSDMARDTALRATRRPDSPLEAKLEALPEEFARRQAQVEAECRVRVRLEPLGLLAIRAPSGMFTVEARRRTRTRSLDLQYDGLSRAWIGLRCDGCGAATLAFALCDSARHVLCPRCWDACGSGGRRPCFRCEGKPERAPWSETRQALPREAPTIPRDSAPPEPLPPVERPPSLQDETSLRDEIEEQRSRIIDVLRRGGRPLTSAEIRAEIPADASTLRRLLQPLMESGRVVQTGQRRGTRYSLGDS